MSLLNQLRRKQNRNHKIQYMSIFTNIWDWVKKVFKHIKTDGDKIAIAITEDIKGALDSGVVGGLAKVVSAVFPSVGNLPAEVVTKLQDLIPKVLASELALQGIPDNATAAQILEFEDKILDAFKVSDQKSKLYSVLAAQIYGILESYSNGTDKTFAELLIKIEQAYQDYLADKAASDAGTPMDSAVQ